MRRRFGLVLLIVLGLPISPRGQVSGDYFSFVQDDAAFVVPSGFPPSRPDNNYGINRRPTWLQLRVAKQVDGPEYLDKGEYLVEFVVQRGPLSSFSSDSGPSFVSRINQWASWRPGDRYPYQGDGSNRMTGECVETNNIPVTLRTSPPTGDVTPYFHMLLWRESTCEARGGVRIASARDPNQQQLLYAMSRRYEVDVANVEIRATVTYLGGLPAFQRVNSELPDVKAMVMEIVARLPRGAAPPEIKREITPPPKAEELPDLQITPDDIAFSYSSEDATFPGIYMPKEDAADLQTVMVRIRNVSQTVPAEDVRLQLTVTNPDKTSAWSPRNIRVGRIEPGGTVLYSVVWDLQGRNMVNVVFDALVLTGDMKDDANERDNEARLTLSIRYAHNGARAFSWKDDTYSFANGSMPQIGAEESIEGAVSTLFAAFGGTPAEKHVWQRLTFDELYRRTRHYFSEGRSLGVGGHCYGMSATVAEYFARPALRPLNKNVRDLTIDEASAGINLYHRAQMLPVLDALGAGELYPRVSQDLERDLLAIRSALDTTRTPQLISLWGWIDKKGFLYGDSQAVAHSLLAYKLIEVDGRDAVIYLYDPNFPEPAVPRSYPMPQFVIPRDGGVRLYPPLKDYTSWAKALTVDAPARELPIAEINKWAPQVRSMAYATADNLRRTRTWLMVLRCPADVVFTDANGRRTGTINGQPVNEIPGAEQLTDGEVETYLLPAQGEYTSTITGTGSGTASLDMFQVGTDNRVTLQGIENVPVQRGVRLTGAVSAQGQLGPIQGAAGAHSVTLTGAITLDRLKGGATDLPPVIDDPSAGSAASTFETGPAGWTVGSFPDGGPYDMVNAPGQPNWAASDGRQGGAISLSDPGSGNFFFGAPDSFLGNKAAYYRGQLRYELRTEGGTYFDEADVILISHNLVLVHSAHIKPTAQWTTVSIPLSEGGWHVGAPTGRQATANEFERALGQITALRIRGEFGNGPDKAWLDNVALVPPSSQQTIAGILIGDEADPSGRVSLVEKPALDRRAPKIYVTVQVADAVRGTIVAVSLTYLGNNVSLGPLNNAITVDGNVSVAFSFTNSAKEWPTGDFRATVRLPDGTARTKDFRIE